MEKSRDLSLWRSLAVAFGDGLAFGVGVKLTQTATRQSAAPRTLPAVGGSLDRSVLEAVVNALEARLNEHTAQVDRRLAEIESRMARETTTVREEVAEVNRDFAQSVGMRMERDLSAVRDQIVSVNREFAQSVSRIVAEQVAEAASASEEKLAELRQKVAAIDSNMLEFVLAMGQMCRQASERATAPPPRRDPGPPAAVIEPSVPSALESDSPPAAEAQAGLPAPEFTQTRNPTGLWRVPLVSSLIVTVGGLLAMHYL